MNGLYALYKAFTNRLGGAKQDFLPAAPVDAVPAGAPIVPTAPPPRAPLSDALPFLTTTIDNHFYPWLVDLTVFSDPPLTEFEAGALDSLKQTVTGQTFNTQMVPRLPAVIPQLMHSLKDEKISGARLAQQIAKDPALVGEVIRLANSPFYRRSRKIASIEQAVILVGQNGLRQLIARVAFYPILNLRSGSMTRLAGARLWAQSERCALICRCLAEKAQVDSFAAYLSGLVSNVGMIVGLHLMDQLLNTRQDGIPASSAFYEVFIAHSEKFSCRIVEEWGFPENVILAIHEKAEHGVDDATSELGKLLSQADQYSKISVMEEHRRLPEEIDINAMKRIPCFAQTALS